MKAITAPRAVASRLLSAMEPWYDCGTTDIFRLNARCPDFTDESAGEGRQFQIQWLGIHVAIVIGCTPPSVGER